MTDETSSSRNQNDLFYNDKGKDDPFETVDVGTGGSGGGERLLSSHQSDSLYSESSTNLKLIKPVNDNIENDLARTRSLMDEHEDSNSNNGQLVPVTDNHPMPKRLYWPGKSHFFKPDNEEDDEDSKSESLIDHAWSRRILELVGTKSKLMESFCWLSTVGGGYSALGENDRKFSSRAGALSLGQQLHLAELLGDERLEVMCHLFAALAALQMNNKQFCLNYIKKVILPLIYKMPYRDPLLNNILKHICFRMGALDRYARIKRLNAIEAAKRISNAPNQSNNR